MTQQDLSPLLCDPAKKAELETRNTGAQLDCITFWIKQGARKLRESHVRELHRLAVEEIYPCGGQYRRSHINIKISDSGHRPPRAAMVPSLVIEAVDWCNDSSKYDGLTRAAYALWRFNWIHPFAGGNGRTARAITYLVIAMDLGIMPPGIPTIPAAIAKRRDHYVKVLRQTDERVKNPFNEGVVAGAPKFLFAMRPFVAEIVVQQLVAGLLDAQK